MNQAKPLRLKKDFAVKNLDSGLIALNLGTGEYFRLNETASVMLEHLRAGLSPTETTNRIVDEYDVAPECVAHDIENLVNQLVELGIVVRE